MLKSSLLPVFVLCALITSDAFAQTSARSFSESWSSHDGRALTVEDLADGSLEQFDTFTAAILLAGEDDYQRILRARKALATLRFRIAQRLPHHPTDRELAETVLGQIHRDLLTGDYDPGAFDLANSMTGGAHNCVLSTILFYVLADSLELTVNIVSAPEHVRCEIVLPAGSRLRVETTSPNGVARRKSHNPLSKNERRLTECELLAKVVYNRGLQHLREGQFSEALSDTELSHQLDPQHDAAAANVLAIVNNWALHLCNRSRFEEAIDLLQRNQACQNDELLRWNRAHIFSRWRDAAIRQNDKTLLDRIDFIIAQTT